MSDHSSIAVAAERRRRPRAASGARDEPAAAAEMAGTAGVGLGRWCSRRSRSRRPARNPSRPAGADRRGCPAVELEFDELLTNYVVLVQVRDRLAAQRRPAPPRDCDAGLRLRRLAEPQRLGGAVAASTRLILVWWAAFRLDPCPGCRPCFSRPRSSRGRFGTFRRVVHPRDPAKPEGAEPREDRPEEHGRRGRDGRNGRQVAHVNLVYRGIRKHPARVSIRRGDAGDVDLRTLAVSDSAVDPRRERVGDFVREEGEGQRSVLRRADLDVE